MGKLNVKGSASIDYEVTIFDFHITVKTSRKVSGEAISLGKEKTEHLLKFIHDKLNIEPNEFTLEEDGIGSYYGDQGYTFTKNFSIQIPASIPVLELFTTALENFSDVTYSIDFKLDNPAEKELEVINAAIEDSRQKAEAIAAALGQKILQAEEVDLDYYKNKTYQKSLTKSITVDNVDSNASKLRNPIETISKEIHITWKTE